MKKTTIFRFICFSIVLGIYTHLGICTYNYYKLKQTDEKTRVYCGKVISKSLDDHYSKHGNYSSSDRRITFRDIKTKRVISVQVNINTFFNTNVGENISFDLSNEFIYGRSDLPFIRWGIFMAINIWIVLIIIAYLLFFYFPDLYKKWKEEEKNNSNKI